MMFVLDVIRFIMFVEMAIIVAVTLRVWSVYSILARLFPKERRLLPIHVAVISVGVCFFALSMAGAVTSRFGEESVDWNITPTGLIAGTATIYALLTIAKHEQRELLRIRELREDAKNLL